MRTIILAATVVATLPLSSVHARADGSWCAYYTGIGSGASNCGFHSYEQCKATVSGIGGMCQPNVNYPAPAARGRKQRYD